MRRHLAAQTDLMEKLSVNEKMAMAIPSAAYVPM